LERELGRPLARVFREIDETPLASASLAQVHRARLRGGAEVVLKVQYPEAWLLFQVDLGTSRALLRSLSAVRGTRHLRALVDEAARLIARELDFEQEARAAERLRRLLRDAPVRVPRVHRRHSTARLLVLEYLPGTRITDLAALTARGIEPREVAARVADLYGAMLFEHGFFQGDPHPGNLLVQDDGQLGLLDFGCVRELPDRFGADLAAMLTHGLARDWAQSVAAARRLGFAFRGDPEATFERLLHAVLGAASRTRGARLPGLGLDEAFYWLDDPSLERIPPELTLVGRVLMQLTGLSEMLAPGERLIPILLAGHLARAARRVD
jgi:ubiquinone biosynthesis protein